MAFFALSEPAPPTMKNSLRPAWLIAARTPTPWSSSWFQMASIFGAACTRFAVTCWPDSTVNWTDTWLLTLNPAEASASAKPLERSCVRGRLAMPWISAITGLLTPFALSCAAMYVPAARPMPYLSPLMSVRDPLGEANSRSRLTTGMPAVCALMAISVSALPSKGRMTSESTFLSISVWTWLICWLTSLLPSTACRVTSLCLAAWSLALVVMAAIQPWSAAGAEKPMVTALPGVSLPLPLDAALAEDVVADDAALLLVHAVRAAPAPRAPAPRSRPRRPRIGPLDEGDIVDLFRWDVQPGWVRSGPVELGGAGGTPLQEHGADDDHALGDVLRL